MVSKEFVLKKKDGMHMRPAQKLSETAGKYSCEITLCHQGRRINAKSIVSVMSACIQSGDEFCVECSGEDEEKALNEIERTLKGDEK